MRPLLRMVRIMSIALVWSLTASHVSPQNATDAHAVNNSAVLTKLSPLVYPPLARQARITGDVTVLVMVAQDGTVQVVRFS